jgi:hypothetical protein
MQTWVFGRDYDGSRDDTALVRESYGIEYTAGCNPCPSG